MINTVVWEIQARAVYSYLTRAVLILGMFLSLIVVLLLSALFSRMSRRLGEPGRTWKTILKIAEAALVATVLAAGLLVRIWYIRTYPLSLESDYKLYYQHCGDDSQRYASYTIEQRVYQSFPAYVRL